jgi:histidinol-phosphate/aromatic aminotransferase/cobyric acid decarboxylase-like protein
VVIPAPGAHGGDGSAVARALGLDPAGVLDLSLSLNPCAPDVAALASRHLESLRRYPDASDATRLLAGVIGVDPERLVLTNGGSEAIALTRARFGGHVVSEPEFALHPRDDGGPTWRSDPHNPTGRLAGVDEHADVWDEAFYPLATGRWTAGRPSLVTLGSLTKVFACPGLRLGFAISDHVDQLVPPEWSVNSLALAMLPDLLASAELETWAKAIGELRADLIELLASHGFTAEPSDANWVLVEAAGLRSRLAHHGVVIRDCTSFGLPHHVRIAVPDERGLEQLATALSR